jgi:hypothetical protein
MGRSGVDGMIYGDSATKFRDIRDGETHTLLFGESLMGFWGDGNSCCARFADDEQPGSGQNLPPGNPTAAFGDGTHDRGTGGGNTQTFDTYWQNSGVHYFGFGSFHADLVQFTMADGSSRSISKTVDFRIMRALATRDGQERIPEF